MNEPTTHVVIVSPPHRHTPWHKRFRQTLSADSAATVMPLEQPEQPVHPHGSSVPVVLNALGHRPNRLQSLRRLSPEHLRHLRDRLYRVRQSGGRLHLFGMLDNDCPYGSRWLVEEVARLTRPTAIPISLHLGVWHPLPSDYRRGLQEIASLQRPNLTISSLFPVEQVLHHSGARHYVDGLRQPKPQNQRHEGWSLPLRQPKYCDNSELAETDFGFILNHSFHGLQSLEDVLRETWQRPVDSFSHSLASSQALQRALEQSRHILLVTNQSNYASAFLGAVPHHPYFESMVGESSEKLVEMLISPHFGYHRAPYRTIVLLDEASTPHFDWLVSSLVKHKRDTPYTFLWVNPTELRGHRVMSNHITDPSCFYHPDFPYA